MAENTLIARACSAWRAALPVHPAAEIIPSYTDAELLELGRDIKTSGGMKIPVIALAQAQGFTLLDGRSRLDGMCSVGGRRALGHRRAWS